MSDCRLSTLFAAALALLAMPLTALAQCPEPPASEVEEYTLCEPLGEPLGVPFVDKIIVGKLLNGLCKLAGVSCSASCRSDAVTQNLFAGITLGPQSGPAAPCESASRGPLMARAGLCLLVDLETAGGIRNDVGIDLLGLVPASLHQEIGLLSFDPSERAMTAFHAVSVCVPLLGCINNVTQEFGARLRTSLEDGIRQCGDFPITSGHLLQVQADDSDVAMRVTLPGIPIGTPIGTVSVQPVVGYETHMKAIFSPYPGVPTHREDVVAAAGCPGEADFCDLDSQVDGLRATLTDVYDTGEHGESCGVGLISAGTAWSSQAGFGGRNPGEPVWDFTQPLNVNPVLGGRPDLLFGCPPDTLTPARNAAERSPVAQVDTGLKVVLDLQGDGSPLAGFLRTFFHDPPLKLKAFNVFIEPTMGARFTSQFDAAFSEGVYTPGPIEFSTCVPTKENVARVLFPSAVAANSFFKMTAGLNFDLKLELRFRFFGKTRKIAVPLLKLNPTFDIVPEVGDSVVSPGRVTALAESRTDLSPGAPVADPRAPTFSRLVRFSEPTEPLVGAEADAFIQQCLQGAPLLAAPPEPTFEEASPEERLRAIGALADELLFPCNFCLGVGGPFDYCVVDDPTLADDQPSAAEDQAELERRSEDECELLPADTSLPLSHPSRSCASTGPSPCRKETATVRNVGTGDDPDADQPLRHVARLLPVPQDGFTPDRQWACDSTTKHGCFDLCRFDPTSQRYVTAVRSAVDLQGGHCRADVNDPLLPCQVDADCDDGNPCTQDVCGAGDIGCLYTPSDGACDDGLFCTGLDTCRNGACERHAGNPCFGLPSDGTCSETTDACVATCEDGDSCDDGDACTTADTCTSGFCIGQRLACDDQNPCTDDRCDVAANAPLCAHANNGTCIGENCGNATIDPGESCDPPNLTVDPASGEPNCRLDCTSCGDGVVQPNDQETCDDGNAVSGCDPRRPARELDDCQTNCTPPICSDPARITDQPAADRLDFHGRLTLSSTRAPLEPSDEMVAIQLTAPDGTVLYRSSLLPGALERRPTGSTRYADRDARHRGGIARLRLQRVRGAYRATIRAYGDLSAAEAVMTTHVFVGDEHWTIRGRWQRTSSGWRLTAEGTVSP